MHKEAGSVRGTVYGVAEVFRYAIESGQPHRQGAPLRQSGEELQESADGEESQAGHPRP